MLSTAGRLEQGALIPQLQWHSLGRSAAVMLVKDYCPAMMPGQSAMRSRACSYRRYWHLSQSALHVSIAQMVWLDYPKTS